MVLGFTTWAGRTCEARVEGQEGQGIQDRQAVMCGGQGEAGVAGQRREARRHEGGWVGESVL